MLNIFGHRSMFELWFVHIGCWWDDLKCIALQKRMVRVHALMCSD
jgi:hypothetical protein